MRSIARSCSWRSRPPSLGRESDSASQERLQGSNEELAELGEQQSSLNAQWQEEKGAIDDLSGLSRRSNRPQLQVEQAERNLRPQQSC